MWEPQKGQKSASEIHCEIYLFRFGPSENNRSFISQPSFRVYNIGLEVLCVLTLYCLVSVCLNFFITLFL